MDMVTAAYSNFLLGIDNLSPDNSLERDARSGASAARDIENHLILKDGSLQSRPGYTVTQAFAGGHSLWSHPDAGVFFVRASVLYEITSFAPYTEALVHALASNDPMHYEFTAGALWVSNGTDIGKVVAGAWEPHALPTPTDGAAVAAAGTMPAGEYVVAFTYGTSAGLEGGAQRVAVTLSAAGSISATLPSTATGADVVNVYCTSINGGVPLLVSSPAVGSGPVTINAEPTGRSLTTDGLQPLPAGKLKHFNGRMLSAAGSLVYASEPYKLGHYDPISGFVQFPGTVRVVAPVMDGVWVVADKTYFVAGGNFAAADAVREVAPYSASADSEFVDPSTQEVGWFSDVGLVLAGDGGELKTVQFDHMATDTADTAACVIHEAHGGRYAFVSLSGNVTTSARISDDVQ